MGECVRGVTAAATGGRTPRVTVVAAALAVLLAGSCSSGGGSAPKANQSAKEFAQAYTTTEAAFQDRTTALQKQGRSALGQGEDAVVGVYKQLLTSTRTALKQFEQLSPPDTVKTAYDALVKAMRAQVTALEHVLQGVHDHEAATITASLRSYASSLADFLQATKSLQLAVPGLRVTTS